MARQILAFAVGLGLSVLGAAAGGYALYRLSNAFPNEVTLGNFARYFIEPFVALLVGASVGLLAKYKPELISVLSLLPSQILTLFSRKQNVAHTFVFVFLALVYLFIGAITASAVFRIRGRKGAA
jgi:hypothetical protein